MYIDGLGRIIPPNIDFSAKKSIIKLSKPISTRGQKYNIVATHISIHAQERMEKRDVSMSDIEDAIKNPLHMGSIKTDKRGRSVRLTGEKATVNINPDTGMIITAWKTGEKTKRKYTRGNNEKV